MKNNLAFLKFSTRLLAFINRTSKLCESGHTASSEEGSSLFNDLALELFALQYEYVPVYRQFCARRGVLPQNTTAWDEIPAIPTTGFKEYELSSLPVYERTNEFRSSGTTGHTPSRHFHNAESLSVYEASLRLWFEMCVLSKVSKGGGDANDSIPLVDCTSITRDRPGTQALRSGLHHLEKWKFVNLTPFPERVPHSSLVHMFGILNQKFGTADSAFTGELDADGGWELNFPMTMDALEDSVSEGEPVFLLGTAFSFVQLTDYIMNRGTRFQLPLGSKVFETGGYKGRSRSLDRGDLHSLISKYLGVAEGHIICEYGMSELSSQAYAYPMSLDAKNAMPSSVFTFPPWARVTVISPETGAEAEEGEQGLIRVLDLANVRSVMAILTEDLGVRRGSGFELVGRTANAEPRGCSLMAV